MLNKWRFSLLAVVGVLVASATIALVTYDPGKASSGDQVLTSISDTTTGQRLASEAVERYKANGVTAVASELEVLAVDGGREFVVQPKGLDLAAKVETEIQGSGVIMRGSFEVAPSGNSDPEKQVSQRPVLSFAPYWQLNNSYCYSRISTGFGTWMDTCWKIYNMANDGDSTWDYWTFETFATAHSDRTLDHAWISTDESSSGDPQYWVDWDPGSDTTGSCNSSYSVSVSAYGVGVSHTFVRCETWDITKYADAAHFTSKYDGDSFGADREVGHMTLTKLAEQDSPSWTIGYEVKGCWGFCQAVGGP